MVYDEKTEINGAVECISGKYYRVRSEYIGRLYDTKREADDELERLFGASVELVPGVEVLSAPGSRKWDS